MPKTHQHQNTIGRKPSLTNFEPANPRSSTHPKKHPSIPNTFGHTFFLFFLLFLIEATCFSQENEEPSFSGVIPEILIRPSREKTLIYPIDAVIGQLGSGEASLAANNYARNILRDLMRMNKETDSLQNFSPDLLDEAIKKLGEVTPRKVRLGGGRDETDGSVSFLFRFMGAENELSGEIYIRSEEGKWKAEDIIFEEPRPLSIGSESFTSTYTPYERFY
ncbi:MAG: hypothetical protein LBJ35_03635 [Spirochaetaceae bacterium]|jgi:hypothetical protein|nr:hypothetical protein [Spirochaetaceae bacterium]